MRRLIPATFVALLVFSAACFAKERHAPLPTQLVTAKTVYIENQGSAKIADKLYEELRSWGRFQLVDSPEAADVVLQLSVVKGGHSSGTTSSYDYKTNTWNNGTVHANSDDQAQIIIRDRQTGTSLYSDTRSGGGHAIRKLIQELRNRIDEQSSGRR